MPKKITNSMFLEKIKDLPIDALEEYKGDSVKLKIKCTVCNAIEYKSPNGIYYRGCIHCRSLNKVVSDDGDWLLIDISTPKHPDATMKIDKVDWLRFIKEYKGRVYMVKHGYPSINSNGSVKRIHKIIAGYTIADHANRDRSDNRRCNLRSATASNNAMNRSLRSDNSSGMQGVNKSGERWSVRIQVDGNRKFIGEFEILEDAIKARVEAENKYFGEFSPHKQD